VENIGLPKLQKVMQNVKGRDCCNQKADCFPSLRSGQADLQKTQGLAMTVNGKKKGKSWKVGARLAAARLINCLFDEYQFYAIVNKVLFGCGWRGTIKAARIIKVTHKDEIASSPKNGDSQ
jgi:hypothetical protein